MMIFTDRSLVDFGVDLYLIFLRFEILNYLKMGILLNKNEK